MKKKKVLPVLTWGKADNRKYFHELSDKEVKALIDSKPTWEYMNKHYKQPSWCTYPNALNGIMGCWSLILARGEISPEFCKACECYTEVAVIEAGDNKLSNNQSL